MAAWFDDIQTAFLEQNWSVFQTFAICSFTQEERKWRM
jgi:hypothetical protein